MSEQRLQQTSSWTKRRDEKECRMQAVMPWMSGPVLPTDKIVEALEVLVVAGDRIVLEGDNQKQADFLSRSLVKVDAKRIHDLHLIISSISRPEHLTLFELGIAKKVDFAFAGPQSLRVAQLLEDGVLEIGAIHTYVELYARLLVDLIPNVVLVCAEQADREGNLFTGPNTEDTPVIVEAAAFHDAIVIVQVNELVEKLPRVDIPGSWIDIVVQADKPFALEPLFTRKACRCRRVLPALALSPHEDCRAHHWLPPRHRRLIRRWLPSPGTGIDFFPGAFRSPYRTKTTMTDVAATKRTIDEAVSQLGSDPLTEESVQQYIAPLFSRVLASDCIYLANHSLGRPLDAMAEDVCEATSLWETKLGDAWDAWLAEQEAFRARIAQLIHAPRVDCIVPKTSAGQGLRAVLNMLAGTPRVLSTRGEFDSIDLLLKQYASLGRIELRWVEAGDEGLFTVPGIMRHLRQGIDLVVISQVMFMNGQAIHNLEQLADACHSVGAKLLVDSYHAVGVFPVDVAAMRADFAIGGSYKYLRGGPGACFLCLSPEILASGLRPLDTGWFARENTFGYERHDPPLLRAGGDAFLESTPPVITYYQARSGQQFTLAINVERLREYRQKQLSQLKLYLVDAGIDAIGGDADHGAFLCVRHTNASTLAKKMAVSNVIVDARGEWLRICPDCLTREDELRTAASALYGALKQMHS